LGPHHTSRLRRNNLTFQEFDKFQTELLAQVVVMKDTKGKEYANSADRFANFNRLSERLNLTNLKIALVYLTKHMDAIESYISRGRTYSTETIQGRIVDAITYLTLIAGMISEYEQDDIKVMGIKELTCTYGYAYPCNLFGTTHTKCDYTGLTTPETVILKG
jgi:hypothetical protein